jgi:hypothetical protein
MKRQRAKAIPDAVGNISSASGKPMVFETVQFDFDAVWAALSRSTKLRAYMDDLATQVAREAAGMAATEANDEGYYSKSFEGFATPASAVRRVFKEASSRRNRRRRGQEGTNRLIDRPGSYSFWNGKTTRNEVKGDIDGSEYDGTLGVVVNTDYKAHFVEYGSLSKGPRFILNRAAEKVAKATGNTYDRLYAKEHQPDLEKHRQVVSEGLKKIYAIRRNSK